ncbi:MAG: nitroreductase family protein [Treponema sp.]|jgi:nitroreductase|nr:nitroreductase family protein [Treponema sp.]
MKKTILILCVIFFTAAFIQAQNAAGIRTIINHYAARNFLPLPVSQSDLDQIIRAGVNAPSARNAQPWHFTIVQNAELARRIISGVTDGNVLIVISAAGDSRTNIPEILDCALAAQSIYLAAQALGLGSRIYTAPVAAVNRDLKNALSLPRDHSVVVIVRIGRVEQVDAASAASSRKAPDSIVTYKK